jgi:hypothetical protein
VDTPRRSPVRWIAAVFAAILIASVCALCQVPAAMQVCQLPDGSILKLEAVSYGRQHHFVSGPWWRRLLVRLLPPSLRGLVSQATPVDRAIDSNTLIFWISRDGPTRAPVSFSRAVVFDERGRELDVSVPTDPHWESGEVRDWLIPVFPRRAHRIGLRIFQRVGPGPSAPVAEFVVANPAPGRYPTWRPEPVPITRRDGDLAVTLTQIITGLKENGPVRPPWSRGEGIWTCATACLSQNDRPTGEWQVIWMSLSDATGNVNEPIGFDRSPVVGERHGIFLGSLWPDESAWKVRVECTRTARFAPSDLWTVRGLAVARNGAMTESNATAARHGVTLRLVGMFGGRTHPKGDQFFQQTDLTHVEVEAVSPPDALRIGKGFQLSLPRATDDRGRPVLRSQVWITSSGQYNFELEPAAGAKTVNLTFAVAKSRFIQFIARPTWGWKRSSSVRQLAY